MHNLIVLLKWAFVRVMWIWDISIQLISGFMGAKPASPPFCPMGGTMGIPKTFWHAQFCQNIIKFNHKILKLLGDCQWLK